jgi:hypothetical protein
MRARQSSQPQGRQEWLAIARARILRVLRRRIAATLSQLEVKVCECGPAYLRPDPHIMTDALAALVATGCVRRLQVPREPEFNPAPFYTLAEYDPQPALARVDTLLAVYRGYRSLTDCETSCSRALEDLVRASFKAAGGYRLVPNRLTDHPLDGVYDHGHHRLGLEVKNSRSWVYPSSGRVWVMVGKCLAIDALPVLVCRKRHYVTHRLFQELGILCFQTHRQIFAMEVAPLLGPIQHTDLLGFKDVIALPPAPYAPLVTFLRNTVPSRLDDCRARWHRQRDLLVEFAITRGLGDPAMPDWERWRHWPEFGRRVLKNSE